MRGIKAVTNASSLGPSCSSSAPNWAVRAGYVALGTARRAAWFYPSAEHFRETPRCDGAYVNGGFSVREPSPLDYIENLGTFREAEPLTGLAEDGDLSAYQHGDFRHAMDTIRDCYVLDEMWTEGEATSKLWD